MRWKITSRGRGSKHFALYGQKLFYRSICRRVAAQEDCSAERSVGLWCCNSARECKSKVVVDVCCCSFGVTDVDLIAR